MKKQLINPVADHYDLDKFLRELGIPISQSPDGNAMTSIRRWPKATLYGFKTLEDCQSMEKFLLEKEIEFELDNRSVGARYPLHIILREN